jgi:hypothetical protein
MVSQSLPELVHLLRLLMQPLMLVLGLMLCFFFLPFYTSIAGRWQSWQRFTKSQAFRSGSSFHVGLATLLLGGIVVFDTLHTVLWDAKNKGVSRGRDSLQDVGLLCMSLGIRVWLQKNRYQICMYGEVQVLSRIRYIYVLFFIII